MKEGFFEGEDWKDEDFKGLIPKYYTPKYQEYIEEETKLLKQKTEGSIRILEAGVGIGRLIPELAPGVKEFVGIDNAQLMLDKSRLIAAKFPNTKVVEGDLEDLKKIFPPNHFDFSMCLWNTLGNVADEAQVLKQIAAITRKSIFVTVYHKGTIEDRKAWYKKVGVELIKIDKENEIFYSKSGLKSKSYSIEDMQEIANKANLKIQDSRVLAGVILWVEFCNTRKQQSL